jgi:hypothetical protein
MKASSLTLVTEDNQPWRHDFALLRVPANTRDSESVEWARNRLQECWTSHPACGRGGSAPAPLPTRLLDLDLVQSTLEGVRVRLLELGNDETGIYACLSHCWGIAGATNRLQTVKATLAKHKEGLLLL